MMLSYGKALLHAKNAGHNLEEVAGVVLKGTAGKARAAICRSLGISERMGYLYLKIHRNWRAISQAAEAGGMSLQDLSIRGALALLPKRNTKRITAPKNSLRPAELTADSAVEFVECLHLSDAMSLQVAASIAARAATCFGGHFTVAVTPGDNRPEVPAELNYRVDADGLDEPWFGAVWVDLTTTEDSEVWLEKLAAHLADSTDPVDEAIVLFDWLSLSPTSLAKLLELKPAMAFFLQSRTTGCAPSSSPVSTVLAYIGPNVTKVTKAFEELAVVMLPATVDSPQATEG